MKDNLVFDTNILVYAFDLDEPEKRDKCLSLVENVFKGESTGIVTNQIVAEFYSVLMRKKISQELANSVVSKIILSPNWVKINYTYETVLKAIFFSSSFSIPFWDGLVAATMIENGLSKIYTENIRDFSKIRAIKAENPLK